MLTIISTSRLGVLVLFLGMMKKKAWLLPVIFIGLLAALAVTFEPVDTRISTIRDMLVFDNVAVAFSSVLIFSTFLIMMFASHYYRPVERPLEDVYGVMIFALVGAVLMVSYGNLIMLFLGIETFSISLYILAGSHKEAITSNEATLKYFLLGSFISGFLLFGIALIYGSAHSFDLVAIKAYVDSGQAVSQPIFRAGLYLMIIGLAFKIAIVPFHFWAPDVYEGTPTLLTAFMASVVKTASIVALYKLFSITMGGGKADVGDAACDPGCAYDPSGKLYRTLPADHEADAGLFEHLPFGYMMLAVVAFGSVSANALLFYTLSYSIATITAFAILMLVREAFGNDHFEHFQRVGEKQPAGGAMPDCCIVLADRDTAAGGFHGEVLPLFGCDGRRIPLAGHHCHRRVGDKRGLLFQAGHCNVPERGGGG